MRLPMMCGVALVAGILGLATPVSAGAANGVPTFAAGMYKLVGAQPYEALEQLINKARDNNDRSN